MKFGNILGWLGCLALVTAAFGSNAFGETPKADGFGCAKPRAATASEVALIRKAMEEKLLDSDSAKFLDVKICEGDEGHSLCGKVNAKNSYGAYAGYKGFMGLLVPNKEAFILAIDDSESAAAESVCRKSGYY
ncbi:MAG: hypothetical protein OMOMHJEC_01593 [Xanthomonadales bacterium]|nr:hypothetical protein [Xanthomonadales bacterium]